MSEIKLVIRDGKGDISGICHAAFADRVVAALCDEPETITELEAALERFEFPSGSGDFRFFNSSLDDQPHDAGIIIIDLVARLVASESTYSSLSRCGHVSYHDGHCATELSVSYHLSDNWKFTHHMEEWESLAVKRRTMRSTYPPVDVRAIVYGKPLLEFVARQSYDALAEFTATNPMDDPDVLSAKRYDLMRQIHIRWMLTKREDLRGVSPREAMLEHHDYVSSCMHDREEQWSQTLKCPRGLDVQSAAFRYSGFGLSELVMYYEMVRELLAWCFEPAEDGAKFPERPSTAGEFMHNIVPQLAAILEEWMDAPDPEFYGRTPREITHDERARLPAGLSGRDAMIDCDCPLCQMQAEQPGPVFWCIDGCNMDEDFAFSFHRTYEQWEQEQRQFAEFSRPTGSDNTHKESGSEKLDHPSEEFLFDDDPANTSDLFAPVDPTELSTAIKLFKIGAPLAELIGLLKQPPENRPMIDRLNRNFGNLRDVIASASSGQAAALLEPVLNGFLESLADLRAARHDLEPRIATVQDQITQFFPARSD